MTVSVSSTGLCSGDINLPCTSVTVCVPGTNHCQTISDILVDTGSFGLRIFSQAIPQNLCSGLPIVTDTSSRPIAECAQFGSATDWGPIANADVQLGGKPVVNTSIQIIHRTYGTPSSACGCAENSPQDAGINGILGVGLFAQDCGTSCATNANIGLYYGCSGSNCSGTKVPLANQVTNPVALLTADNNGVIMNLPSVGAGGATGVSGTLTLGIDTADGNNSSTGLTKYPADGNGNFSTTFNSHTLSQSFIDSGSNVYIFPDASLATCSDSDPYAPGFFCPGSTQNLSATTIGSGGSPSTVINFSIANLSALLQSGPTALSNAGYPATGGFSSSFDWGLPFFFGRKVIVGIQGKSSNLGTGPYWAY